MCIYIYNIYIYIMLLCMMGSMPYPNKHTFYCLNKDTLTSSCFSTYLASLSWRSVAMRNEWGSLSAGHQLDVFLAERRGKPHATRVVRPVRLQHVPVLRRMPPFLEGNAKNSSCWLTSWCPNILDAEASSVYFLSSSRGAWDKATC